MKITKQNIRDKITIIKDEFLGAVEYKARLEISAVLVVRVSTPEEDVKESLVDKIWNELVDLEVYE